MSGRNRGRERESEKRRRRRRESEGEMGTREKQIILTTRRETVIRK